MKKFLKLNPIFKDYIWGGNKLKTNFSKKSENEIIAESWELACHKDGNCTLDDGQTLQSFISENKNVLGKNCEKFENFPVLIKLIDAKENLSIQVHPDNKYALENEGEYGKTEMWYIVDCEQDAYLYYGFKTKISKDELENRLNDGSILEVLNKVYVKKGDVFFIEAGTVHAIGKGILIAEVQQNSNTTYRIFDYNRVGADGKPRELHIKKALDVINLETIISDNFSIENKAENQAIEISKCDYFSVFKAKTTSQLALEADNNSFVSLLITEGSGELVDENEQVSFNKGDSFFVPAGSGEFFIKGECETLITRI